MKIAVWHNLPSGGGKRAMYDHVRGLVARGHTVEAWCPPTADREFLPLSSLIEEHVVDLAWPEGHSRLETWRIERKLEAMEAHCKRCADEISEHGFDVLLANPCRFFRTSPIARYTRLPSVLYLQEPYRSLYEALPRLWWLAPSEEGVSLLHPSRWRSAVGDWLWVRTFRVQGREELRNAFAFKRILVNSYFSRESVLRAYGLDSDVCYLGIDTSQFVDRGLARDDYVVGLGSISPEKNLKLVIEAIGAMPTPRPKLVWIGNFSVGEYHNAMTALAKERGVALDLRVGVSDEELIGVLNRAMVMVYAPRLEPFGLAPLEANACGVPVVAVREGGVRETVQHEVNGLLADADPQDLARCIAKIRNNPALAAELRANARKLVDSEWSLDAAVSRLEKLLIRYSGSSRLVPTEQVGELQSAAI